MTELKPCPFCGSHDVEYYETGDYGFPFNYVCCRDCPASVRESSEQAAITAWNTRTDDKHLGQLGNLLAIIHRDGGHYVETYGLEKATEDAIKKVSELIHKRQADIVLLKRAYSLGYDSGRAGNSSLEHGWDRDKYFFSKGGDAK